MDNEIAAIHETSKMTNQSEQSKLSGLGARLRKTRESMHLTQKEAAARLYLNPKIVEVIENEAFYDGPPMTFMRGYLRSYARLLNFPESEIKAAIDELELNTILLSLQHHITDSLFIVVSLYSLDSLFDRLNTDFISRSVVEFSFKYVIADVPSTNARQPQI